MKMKADWHSNTKLWEESLLDKSDGAEEKAKLPQDDKELKIQSTKVETHNGGSICLTEAADSVIIQNAQPRAEPGASLPTEFPTLPCVPLSYHLRQCRDNYLFLGLSLNLYCGNHVLVTFASQKLAARVAHSRQQT